MKKLIVIVSILVVLLVTEIFFAISIYETRKDILSSTAIIEMAYKERDSKYAITPKGFVRLPWYSIYTNWYIFLSVPAFIFGIMFLVYRRLSINYKINITDWLKITQGSWQGKALSRESIRSLHQIAYKQAEAGDCLAAVESFLQVVEIDPLFTLDNVAWQHIGSVFTGKNEPIWGKNWIKISKELIPDDVERQLARLPNYSMTPNSPFSYVEPPSETEIMKLIGDIRAVIIRYTNLTSASSSAHGRMSVVLQRQIAPEGKTMTDQEMISILRRLCIAYSNNDRVYKELEPIAT